VKAFESIRTSFSHTARDAGTDFLEGIDKQFGYMMTRDAKIAVRQLQWDRNTFHTATGPSGG